MWLHSLKVAQLLRSAACLHTNQSRSYLNHLVYQQILLIENRYVELIVVYTSCLPRCSYWHNSGVQRPLLGMKVDIRNLIGAILLRYINYYYYYWYSAIGPVWAETRAQSDDWYGTGTLHPWQVLRGSLPLLSPAF